MTGWADRRYVVVDVEGNGQQPPDIVEVATVPIVDGVIGEPQSWLVKPPRPVTQMTVRIHGLTNPELVAAPPFADIEKELRQALDAQVLVAHNAHVDVGVLQRHWLLAGLAAAAAGLVRPTAAALVVAVGVAALTAVNSAWWRSLVRKNPTPSRSA